MVLANANNLQEIDAQTLKQWLDHQQVMLIDVREPGEYASEHIPGAKLMPLSNLNPVDVKPETDQQVVLYCQSGNRSKQAAQKLFDSGFESVNHLQGGLPTWKSAGYQTQVNKNAPISLFRQVQIVAGTLVFTGTVLGAFVSPWFLILSGFVGAGLVFAGVSGTCAMGMLLAKLPYNQRV
ncbi:rhodanese-like domain-containing protein [Coleofasciculus sp. E1-EBD-02]|jgi:rhodanese-related sulfurtransferase|uniref:rhodanese-like domain-containing protein n=1 Tax=Coleofasciculus sp. E1-EBD-02 TaxID=3068481 RepID=UPI0032F5EAAA